MRYQLGFAGLYSPYPTYCPFPPLMASASEPKQIFWPVDARKWVLAQSGIWTQNHWISTLRHQISRLTMTLVSAIASQISCVSVLLSGDVRPPVTRPIWGSGGFTPSGVQAQSPLVRGRVRGQGASHLKLKHVLQIQSRFSALNFQHYCKTEMLNYLVGL